LKSINGEDVNNPSSTANNIFSMSLEYYQNDYIPANGNTGTYTGSANYVGSYTGNITAWRWKNRVGNTNVDGHWGYEYLYNDRNELMTAQFGNIHGNYSGTNPTFWTNLTDNYKVSGINYDKNGNITALQRTDGNGSFMDRLAYQYYNGTNKLSKIQDLVATASNGDIANQGNNNYTYSQIGELIQDNSENNKIIYDVYGKVTEVKTITNVTKAKYYYDGSGQRIKKETYNSTTVKTTWYIAGHIYESVGTNGEILHTEITISGAGRLGVAYTNTANNSLDYNYELSDHLGNVRAVIRKAAPGSTNPIDILSYADYFPFGWQMPGRNQQGDYRYAYQGQEKDPETGWEAFELRMYDGRVGRWMTTDPYSQYHSPYLAMGNNPISRIDPDGGSDGQFDVIMGMAPDFGQISSPPPPGALDISTSTLTQTMNHFLNVVAYSSQYGDGTFTASTYFNNIPNSITGGRGTYDGTIVGGNVSVSITYNFSATTVFNVTDFTIDKMSTTALLPTINVGVNGNNTGTGQTTFTADVDALFSGSGNSFFRIMGSDTYKVNNSNPNSPTLINRKGSQVAGNIASTYINEPLFEREKTFARGQYYVLQPIVPIGVRVPCAAQHLDASITKAALKWQKYHLK
jgi:RHS repeat-associated protein